MKDFNWDFSKAINAKSNTILHPGSEYHPTSNLSPIFGYHVDWKKFVNLASMGAKYHFKKDIKYTSEMYWTDLCGAIVRGNNKSALTPEMEKIIQKNYD